ncbi:MAG: hypothetical protein Q9208_006819 [Pyrenodesmia sp. 3 TL-2023]
MASAAESTAASESGAEEQGFFGQGAFLLKTTEVTVESSVAESFTDDQSSDRASTCSTVRDEKRGRGILGKLGSRQSDEQSSLRCSLRSSEDLNTNLDRQPLGTTVSIQAAQPAKGCEQKLHEMKGLEQAASVKRWAGGGKPAEAWGKLMKDPELWDDRGDTLVYFGYQRPQPSFRIKASLLENTKSDLLISKLQEGFQRSVRLSPSRNGASALRGGLKNLTLRAKPAPDLPTVFENSNNAMKDSPIRHEIHFPAPDNASRSDILRHHITTRNLFAFLLDRPLVGLTYYQALTDLHERLLLYMSPEVDCAQLLIRYLTKNNLQDVANDPAAAAGLLAWSENEETRWLEGWREAFVHCIGMYPDLRALPEILDISHSSRTLLDRSHLELQARVEACESRLLTFDFQDMWLHSTSPSMILSRRSFDRFQQFLRQYHERVYKGWPPGTAHGRNDHWLTRDLVRRLQTDFGSLYDYFVDRSRFWDEATELRIRGSIDSNRYGGDTSLTKLLISFDRKHKYPHLPCPYPLLPASTMELFEGKPLKPNIFSTKAKTLEKRTLHACAEASNALLVGAETSTNGLVEAFLRFEKNDLVSEANPREVRQGRWMLLYGILQVLATISVDTPGLCSTDVPYFLNPRFKGNPPWRGEADPVLEEASPELSHCWTVPKTWKYGHS